MMEKLMIHSLKTENYEIKMKKYQGKQHLVVPVVMMVEGVHNGSHGKILHRSEELAKYVESWNVMPVVIQHPEKDGKFISANSPDVLELQKVGQIFNTKIENKKLIAEAWLEEEKLKEISMKAYKAIKNGEPLDVSIGIFNDETEEMGNYSGTEYKAIAFNYKPDHLALLPGGQGACSWADGCGIRANTGELNCMVTYEDIEVKFKQNYQINAGGAVELIGDPVDVELINKQKEVKIMSNAKDCSKCLEKVNALLANKSGKWTEADREWLLTQDEGVLDKLVPEVIEKTVEVNKLSASDQADLAWARKQREEKRAGMIKEIQSNTKDVWTEDELNAMSEVTLEKIAASTGKVDHSLNGNVINTNSGVIAPLGGPEMIQAK